MPDFYFPPDETLSVDYEVTVTPAPADNAQVTFYRHQIGGDVIGGQSLQPQGTGTVTQSLSGLTVADSPIMAEFVFEKANGQPQPRVTVPVAFSLAEPVVEDIQAPEDAKPGDAIELGVIRWGADAYDAPGVATRFSGVPADRIPQGMREQARWFLDGNAIGEGEACNHTIQDSALGTTLQFEAYMAAPSGATKQVVVPRLEVKKKGGTPAPEVIVLGQELELEVVVTPDVAGGVAWTFSDAVITQVSASGREVKIKATADTAAEITITATLTSNATGTQYTGEHKLKVVTLRMHLDADRDGTVDASTDGLDVWEYGTAKKGAIIRANLDDEDAKHATDASNDVVDTAADVSDLAPLELRRGATAFPSGWTAVLTAAPADKVRIFDAMTAAGARVIGPGAVGPHTLADLTPATRAWGMEGVTYPTTGFDGLITLTLELKDPGGVVVFTQTARVRVTPFLLSHHLMETEEVYVVETADNANFRTALSGHVTGAGVAAPVEAPQATYGADRWMQDVMEVGFSTLPSTAAPADRHLPVVLLTANDRSAMWAGSNLDDYPAASMLGPNYGLFLALPPTTGSSLDSFGNLECSPPVTVSGKEWKFGRAIWGHDGARPMQPEVTNFLTAQAVQGAFSIDTSWLRVGHVDEVLSFCPHSAAAKKFKLLLASPAEAITILDRLNTAGHGAVTLLPPETSAVAGATTQPISGIYPAHLRSISGILGDATFRGVQTTVQARIDAIETVLRTNLELDPADIIKIPVLFREQSGRYIAYTANSVNMLVVTKPGGVANLCVPKPWGPVVTGKCQLEKDIEDKLNPLGNSLLFIDDWHEYHNRAGEIHCGTNSKRKPPVDRWWWEQEP